MDQRRQGYVGKLLNALCENRQGKYVNFVAEAGLHRPLSSKVLLYPERHFWWVEACACVLYHRQGN
jgi:hypothetical protein